MSREIDRVGAANKLLEFSPNQYTKVLGMLMEGHSPRSVNLATGVSIETVKGVQARHPEIATGIREQMLASLTEIQMKALRLLCDNLGEIPIEKLAFTYGIISDKSLEILNRAQEKPHEDHKLDSDALIAELEQLRVVRDIEVEKTDAPPEQ